MIDNVYIPDEGERSALDTWLASADGPALAHLYVNNPVYQPDRVLGDYTEASFVGYSAVGPIAWPASFTNPDSKAESDSPNLTWTFTGGSGSALVYGIYLTDQAVTKLLAVVPFLFPVVLTPGSPTLTRSIQMTDVSEL